MDPYVLGFVLGILLSYACGLLVSIINWFSERAMYYRRLRKQMK